MPSRAVFRPDGLHLDRNVVEHAMGRVAFGKLLNRLTVEARRLPGQPAHLRLERLCAYRIRFHKGDRRFNLILPWRLYKILRQMPNVVGATTVEIQRSRSLEEERCLLARPLYDYQEAVVAALATILQQQRRAYLEMGTGLGKTRTALALAARMGRPTLVVVPTLAIRTQWVEECEAILPGLRVGMYENTRPIDPETHDVVLGIVNTVRQKPPEFFTPYGLVVLDEAHEYCAPRSYEVLWNAQTAYVLGLSATPSDRSNGMDQIVPLHLGQPVRATDLAGDLMQAVRFDVRVREVNYTGQPEAVEPVAGSGSLNTMGTISRLVADPCRLRLVAAEIRRLLGQDLGRHPDTQEPRRHSILVFVEFRDALDVIRQALLEEDIVTLAPEVDGEAPPVDEGTTLLRGGVGADTLRRARESRVVLATYGYARRGLSLTRMTAMVLASPRRSGMGQIQGRITRKGSDEGIAREIVDIRDVASPLVGQSTDRRRAYKEHSYPIYAVRAHYGEYAEPGRPAPEEETVVWRP